MFHINHRKDGLSTAIFGLWRNWAICTGIITALVFVSPFVRQLWMIPLCLVGYAALRVFRSYVMHQKVPVCPRLYKEASVIVLIMTGVIILRNIFAPGDGMFEINGQPAKVNGPLLGTLISSPVMMFVTLGFLLQKREPLVCQLCHLRYGNVVKNGFIGRLYSSEWYFQTRLLFWLALAVTIIDWVYYLIHYININLNRADYFFFIWLPLALYVISLIFLGRRYYSMWMYYCRNDELDLVKSPSSTTVRYIVLASDRILLDIRQTKNFFNNGQIVKRFDTPAAVTLPYQERYDDSQAARLFQSRFGLKPEEVRPIFHSPDTVTYHNMFHYFAFLDKPDEIVDTKLQGEWFTLGELRQLMAQRLTGAELNLELERIYQIAMAWKTYDREGHRLYKFKHYRPTFRLKDIRGWDVDYSDPNWLSIGHLNEDSHLFRLRKWLRKIGELFAKGGDKINIMA